MAGTGVKRRSLMEWGEIIAEQRASGVSQKAWCEANGINYHTFLDRARQVRQRPQWVQACQAPAEAEAETIQVEISGCTVTVSHHTDPELLSKVCLMLKTLC